MKNERLKEREEQKEGYCAPEIVEKGEIRVDLMTSDLPMEPPPPSEGP